MPAGQFRCYWKSHYLSDLSDAVIDEILDAIATVPSPNTLASIWNFGGATAEVAADATAFGDRSMPWMLSIDSVWESAQNDDTNIGWTRDFWGRMQRHSHNGRMYLNFPGQGEEGDKLLQDTFGATTSAPTRNQGEVRPGQPLPLQSEHSSGGVTGSIDGHHCFLTDYGCHRTGINVPRTGRYVDELSCRIARVVSQLRQVRAVRRCRRPRRGLGPDNRFGMRPARRLPDRSCRIDGSFAVLFELLSNKREVVFDY